MSLPAAVEQVAAILFGAGLVLTVAFLLGGLFQRAIREQHRGLTLAEIRLFAFAAGAALLSNFIFFLCSLRLVYASVFLAFAAVVAAASWFWRPQSRPSPARRAAAAHGVFWTRFFLVICAAYGLLYLAHALAPEITFDGIGYHLGLVRRYHREHGFVPVTTSFYAHLTQGAEMLYLFAYAFGRHSAAKMVHFGFFVATIAAILLFARRHGLGNAGIAAAVLYGCSPVVGRDATSAYNDCALAFYQFMVFYALLLWWKDRDSLRPATLAVLAGFCFALKYTGALAVPAVLVVVLWKNFRDRVSWRAITRQAATLAAICALFVAPWLIKNLIVVGNPVAPFFNELFPNPYVTVEWERSYRAFMRSYSHAPEPYYWLGFPFEATVRGTRLEGFLGPIFLLSPLALFAWRQPVAKPLLAAAAVAALPWFANAGTRFLIPSLVFVSLALGIALFQLPPRWAATLGLTLLLLHACSSWPRLLHKWNQGAWALIGIPWKAALRIQPERDYLLANVPSYRTAELIAAEVTPPGRVFSLDSLPEAYFDAELLISYQGALNHELADALRTAVEPDFWPTRRRGLTWRPRPLHGFRIVQLNDHESNPWRMSEIRLLLDGAPVSADSQWKISAQPWPWRAHWLIDGDSRSYWMSWQPQQAGMWIEIRFPRALHLSGAELVYPLGQHFLDFEYFGMVEPEKWERLEVVSEESRREFSSQGLMKWAVQQLAKQGIELLVTNLAGGGNNYLAPLIEKDPSAWGLREIGRDGSLRIYRLNAHRPPLS